MKNGKITIIRAIISFLIIILIIQFIGIEKIQEAVTKIKIEYFALAVLLFVISTFITTLAVLPLLKTKIYQTFKFKAISWSTGLFLPSKIGEMTFPLLLKKTGIPTKKAIAIFFIDRFVSFSIIGLLAFFGAIKYLKIEINTNYFFIFLAVFLVLLITKNKIKEIKIIKKISSKSREIKEYVKKEKKAILINYFFSFINFVVLFWVTQIIFLSIGQKVGLIDIALISSLALFIALIPISINGIGIREGTLVYFYSLIGIKPEYSILVAFVFLVSSYFIAGAFLAVFYNEFSFILKRRSEKVDG